MLTKSQMPVIVSTGSQVPVVCVDKVTGDCDVCWQGYGLLMLEQYKVQADGTLLTRGPGNYKIPTAGNIPQSFNVTLLREGGTTTAIYSSKVSLLLNLTCSQSSFSVCCSTESFSSTLMLKGTFMISALPATFIHQCDIGELHPSPHQSCL